MKNRVCYSILGILSCIVTVSVLSNSDFPRPAEVNLGLKMSGRDYWEVSARGVSSPILWNRSGPDNSGKNR